MRSLVLAAAVAVASALALAPSVSDAKRFGGGSSSGLQRSMPQSTPTRPAAPQQAAPAAAPTTAGAPAAAAAKRSWMGPIAGLAAGLGIAALMSHLGLSEAFGNFLMIALLAMLAVVAVRFFMRRAGAPASAQREQLATAGGAPVAATQPASQPSWSAPAAEPALARSSTDGAVMSADGSTRLAPMPGSTTASVVSSTLPSDFDAEGFSRLAKMIFIRMQAAHDTGDLNDLRAFTTPEMFAVAKLDLQERAGKAQTTDVVHVDAEVLDLAKEGERQVVSVRFHGKIREESDGPVQDFDEIWHLTRFGDNPGWSIAGIQQRH